jgi:hypothetical protein
VLAGANRWLTVFVSVASHSVSHLLVRRRIDYNQEQQNSRPNAPNQKVSVPLAGFAHSVASSTVGGCELAPSENVGAFFVLDDRNFFVNLTC